MSGRHEYILALAPVSRGLGVFVLSPSGRPIDWRVKELRAQAHKNNICLGEVDKLLEQVCPAVLVIEDHRAPGSKRRKRLAELLDLMAELAVDHGVGVARYGPRALRAAFELPPRSNKDKLAAAVAKRLAVLQARLPKQKRIWETERYAMPIFTAAALALTHLGRAQRKEVRLP